MNTREILGGKDFYLYAETAFAHEGSIAYLYQQIDAAAKSGVNGIKFQLLLEPQESYTQKVIENSKTFQWIFSETEWKRIIEYAREKGLDVILLPIDMESLKFCEENTALYEMLEVHSINFNHKYMLERINSIPDKIVILGVGGRTLSDIQYAIEKLMNVYLEKRILLMHGFQSFPTKLENLKMHRIQGLKSFFGIDVGYADHTSWEKDDTAIHQIAYVNGARFFEKHLVLVQGEERTDYQAGVDAEHLDKLKTALRQIKTIQDEENFWNLSESEQRYRNREKRIVSTKAIQSGEIFTSENLGYKVSQAEKKWEQKELEYILGKVALKSIPEESVEVL